MQDKESGAARGMQEMVRRDQLFEFWRGDDVKAWRELSGLIAGISGGTFRVQPMPNPEGKNGYGKKEFRCSACPREEMVQAIIDEVEQDITQSNGPRYVKDKLKDKLILIPRDTICGVMLEHFEAGFNSHYPGKKKTTIIRQSLSAIGPYHEVSVDGHEKLAASALKMGDIGLPIYRHKDKWTADLLNIVTVPDCRTAAAVGHLYLDYLEANGGMRERRAGARSRYINTRDRTATDRTMSVKSEAFKSSSNKLLNDTKPTVAPIQLTTDKGSETGWQYAIQTVIGETFAPDIDPAVYPSTAFLKSVHNTVIEAFWHWLRDKWGINMREHILHGKNEHIYVAEGPIQLDLPTGIRVPKEALKALRDASTDEVGPRESHLAWVSPKFDQITKDVFGRLEVSKITIENSWEVFAQMSSLMESMF
ncbi:hypothetical protein C8R44DRAFT_747860 [Mycena epipterygia]|nr:hypothetical protein C8R44DRAFT_747860 [Mycena epipterygia]